MRTRKFLEELKVEIERHPAVNHLFLNRIATGRFSREDFRVFGENHYPLVCVFTSYLERLLVRAPASESKLWLAKVLVDEYGEGSQGHDHATLYARFLRSAGSPIVDIGSSPSGDFAASYRVPKAALAFIEKHRAIVSRGSFLEGLGAVGPGHEWAIPKMFDSVLLGLRRAGFGEAEIDYFSLHVEQDKDHGVWLEEALASLGHTETARAEIRRGALASLEARHAFWTGVQRAIVRFRQPRSARLDGPVPRSITHEILLTAWDGFGPAQFVERGLRRLDAARQPTLEALLRQTRSV